MDILYGAIRIIGVLLFLYLTWRNLHEDYAEDDLISYSWLALLTMLVVGRLTYGLLNWGIWNDSWWSWFQIFRKPGINFGGVVGGWLVLTYIYAESKTWKVWSFFEDLTPVFYLTSTIYLIGLLGKNAVGIRNLIVLGILLLGLVVSKLIGNKYRSFVWYKSGKKGFTFFFVNLIVGMALAVVSIVYKDNLIWQIIYFGISLFSFLQLFILGEMLH